MTADPIASPLTGSPSIRVGSVPVAPIVEYYRRHKELSVERFFTGLDEVEIRRCPDTGYDFYWPPTTAGDASFYDELADQEWYYEEDRWEHHAAAEHMEGRERVLDVGAGAGGFLELLGRRHPGCEGSGLELSRTAVAEAQAAGIDVQEIPIETYAAAHPGTVDVVTSFQVLEHLAEPLPYLQGLVRVVRPEGLVVIGVPNNEGHMRELRGIAHYALNMPPHHMGLWGPSSLGALPRILPLELVGVQEEPMNEGTRERLAYARMARTLGGGLVARVAWRLGGHRLYERIARERLQREPGHTVLAVFRRTAEEM